MTRAGRRGRLAGACVVGAALAGCADGLSGRYEGEGFFDHLEFRDGGKVEIGFMGSVAEADYVVEGDRVKITRAGETQVFQRAGDGCVDGGGMLGRYCPR